MTELTLRNVRLYAGYLASKYFYLLMNDWKNMFHISWNSALLMTSLVVSVAVQHFSVLIVNDLIHDLVLAWVRHHKIPPGK